MVALPRVAERIDAASEGQQGLVDVGALHETLASILRCASALGARKIDDTEGGHSMGFANVCIAVTLGDIDLQHGVGPRGCGVGCGGGDCAVLVTTDNYVHNLLHVLGVVARQARNGDGVVQVLSKGQALLAAARHEQVTDSLIVDLEV